MGELEDRINSILGDPGEMEKITKLAAQFMGGGAKGGTNGEAGPAAPGAEAAGAQGAFDTELLGKLGRLLSRADRLGSDKTALLKAMSPYLAQSRRDKLERAVKLAQIAKIAGIALEEYGGGRDV